MNLTYIRSDSKKNFAHSRVSDSGIPLLYYLPFHFIAAQRISAIHVFNRQLKFFLIGKIVSTVN